MVRILEASWRRFENGCQLLSRETIVIIIQIFTQFPNQDASQGFVLQDGNSLKLSKQYSVPIDGQHNALIKHNHIQKFHQSSQAKIPSLKWHGQRSTFFEKP